jgi:16S rRNA (adenine1518-N6/adenine1519-N6)-dimethyltransferase
MGFAGTDFWDETDVGDYADRRRGRRWGQNFLQDPAALMEIAEAAPISGKRVLEIGGGHGELTRELSEKVGKKGRVVVLEIDATLADGLQEVAKELGNVKVECVDALTYDFSGFKYIFGNLPYSISTPLTFKILESGFHQSVILVQKEFGERMVAPADSSNYSRLSVAVQCRCTAELIGMVPKESFVPSPKVDSVVVRFTELDKDKLIQYDADLVRLAFCHKNQTLSNALEHSFRELGVTKKQAVERVREKLGQWAGRKVRSIAPAQWQEISIAWKS